MEADEEVYIQFRFENFGYEPGEVVKAKLNRRDDKGVHVTLWCRDDKDYGNAWSDLGSFREMAAMEVIAHVANGGEIIETH